VLNGAAPQAMRYRSQIGVRDVAIFADAHVKFGAHAITSDRSIAEQATDAEWFDADVLIATGACTGSPMAQSSTNGSRSMASGGTRSIPGASKPWYPLSRRCEVDDDIAHLSLA